MRQVRRRFSDQLCLLAARHPETPADRGSVQPLTGGVGLKFRRAASLLWMWIQTYFLSLTIVDIYIFLDVPRFRLLPTVCVLRNCEPSITQETRSI